MRNRFVESSTRLVLRRHGTLAVVGVVAGSIAWSSLSATGDVSAAVRQADSVPVTEVALEQSAYADGTEPGLEEPGDPIEELWTARTRVFDVNESDANVTQVYSGPVNFLEDGEWTPIDTDLVEANTGDTTTESTPVEIVLPAVTSTIHSIAELELPNGDRLSYTMEAIEPTPVTVDENENIARYEDVVPGVSVEFEPLPYGIKETIVVASNEAPATYRFALELDGLTPEIDRGTVVFYGESGQPRFVIPPGTMIDSAQPHGASSDGVAYQLSPDASFLDVTVDQAWLDDPARVFPVYIDPTTLLYSSTTDTFFRSGSTSNFSSSLALDVGRGAAGNSNRAFMRFGLGSLTDMNVHAATVNLWQAEASGSCAGSPTTLHPVTSAYPWGETTWPGPRYDEEYLAGSITSGAGYSSSCPAAIVSTDLTRLTRDWVSGSLPNRGIALVTPNESLYAGHKRYAAAETYTIPSLSVLWTDPTVPGHPSTPSQLSPSGPISTSSATLSATFIDPQGDTGRITFRLYDQNGAPISSHVSSVVSSGATASVTTGALPLDVPVTWRATARNDAATQYSVVSNEVELIRASSTITSPAPYSLLTSSTTLAASLGTGVAAPSSVNLLIDGVVVANDATAPYSFAGLPLTGIEDGYHEASTQLVGGAQAGATSPLIGLYTGSVIEAGPPGTANPQAPTIESTPDFYNMFPSWATADGCIEGRVCQADNGRHTVYLGYLNTRMRDATRFILNNAYRPVPYISIVYETEPRLSGPGETDVIYGYGSLPNNVWGRANCNDSLGASQFRCDQFYVYYDGAQICNRWCDPDNITMFRSIACHETGHTFGLLHGNQADPEPGVSRNTYDLRCMRTKPLVPDTGLGDQNRAMLVATYRP